MKFDENFLQEVGLSAMPESEKRNFLAYVREEVEIRVGERISEGVPDYLLNQFDAVTNKAEAAAWLEKNRPDYREIVVSTIEEIKREILTNRDRLLQ